MTLSHPASPLAAKAHDFSNHARYGSAKFMRAAQIRAFDLVLFIISVPRRVRFAFKDYAASKRTPVQAPPQAMPQPTPAMAPIHQATPQQPQPTIVITPEARGIIALSRENPKLAIMIVCLVMGAIQMGLISLIVFMLHDSGYSSGWGDATKYFVQCEKSGTL